MKLLRQYLHIANPLVVLTFSGLVTQVACGRFHHANGIPRGKSVLTMCGKVYPSKYDHDPAEKDDEQACIIVLCIHPGTLAHSGDDKLLMRLFTKTMAVAWLAMNVSVRVVIRGGQTKREMRNEIIGIIQSQTGVGTDFYDTFEQLRIDYKAQIQARGQRNALLKAELIEQGKRTQQYADAQQQSNLLAASNPQGKDLIEWQSDTPELKAFVTQCRKALDQLYMVVDCDIARDSPFSADRQQQIARLVSLYPECLNVEKKKSDQWRLALQGVKAGKLYYFSQTRIEHRTADIPHLLAFFAEDRAASLSNDWLTNKAAVSAATDKLEKFIMQQIVSKQHRRQESLNNVRDAFTGYLQQNQPNLAQYITQLRTAEKPQTTLYVKSPHLVAIRGDNAWRHGNVYLTWSHQGQDHSIKDLMVPFAVLPILPGEKRYISFVREGVNITDAQGRSLGATYHRPITLPLDHLLTQLSNHPKKADFLALWERECKITVSEALRGEAVQGSSELSSSETIYAYPESFFSDTPHGLPTKYAGGSEAQKVTNIKNEQAPFKPASVGWLLHKFLLKEYPHGGEIDLCSPIVWPELAASSMWTKLGVFLQEPLYHHHPHIETLQAACSGIKDIGLSGGGAGRLGEGPKIVAGFVRLLKILRPPLTQQAKEVKRKLSRRSRTILTVAGNAPNDVVANVPEPELVEISSDATEHTVDIGQADDDDAEETEVGAFEATQGENIQKHASSTSKHKNTSTNLASLAPTIQVPASSPPTIQSPLKRKAVSPPPIPDPNTTAPSVNIVDRRFGEIRHLKHDFLTYCSEKYGWDYKNADSDDEVTIEEEATPQTKRQKTAGKRQQTKEAENPDDEMLLW